MRIHNVNQRSAEWLKLRAGIPTASKFDMIITPQGKRSGQARRLMYQLAYEKISEKLVERDLSNIAHVKHGIDNEANAVAAFEHETGLATSHVGFITNDGETMGCSPDRIIMGHNAALEVKCPTGPVQCGYLIDGMQDAYMAQIQGQILIGRFQCVHFYAWSNELPPYYRIVMPDAGFIASLQQYLEEFVAELRNGIGHIMALGHWPRNAPSVFPDEPDDVA